jgi:hypothetical protein
MPSHSYEVRVSGPVDALDALDDLDEIGTVQAVGQEITTSLSGRFPDQEALSAFLRRLRALGLDVVEIRRVLDAADADTADTADSAGPESEDGGSR